MHHFCLRLNYFQARWPLLNYNAFLDAFIPAGNYRTNGRFLKVWLIFFHRRDFPEETFPLLHPFCIFRPPQLFLCPTDESSCPFGIAVIFKMESDRAEPLAFRRSSGMRQVARSVLKRACHPGTDAAWRRGSGGIFFFGSCVKGALSSPDTRLIMPLQLVAEHSVPWLTRRSGPADPEGEIIAKLQKNPKPSKAGG